ncbi:hypothetical protein [Mesorhizobium wenxiniae]|uniref:hypothetical protein n=1 Tax=Mesorhizobium wenxiniae TaxID=2014805 RepID=UPI001FDA8D12|nr:hypothetical protein [Mesorhizobium wenxiniae]
MTAATELDELIERLRDHYRTDVGMAAETGADIAQAAATLASLTGQAVAPVAFQDRVQPWMMACFGAEISGDKVERGDRLLEEVLELLQSGGYDPARVVALRDYVWSRPAGEPSQEVGGVQVTLAAYCLAFGLNMHEAGETELARIWTKVEKIRAKQAAKPVGSALPVAAPVQAPIAPVAVKALEWEDAIHGGWCALGAAGLYHVHIGYRDETRFYFFTNPFDHEPNDFCSEKAAKAAAQADFEARIRSALALQAEGRGK